MGGGGWVGGGDVGWVVIKQATIDNVRISRMNNFEILMICSLFGTDGGGEEQGKVGIKCSAWWITICMILHSASGTSIVTKVPAWGQSFSHSELTMSIVGAGLRRDDRQVRVAADPPVQGRTLVKVIGGSRRVQTRPWE